MLPDPEEFDVSAVPAAASLICRGYRPLRVEVRKDRTVVVFPAAAEQAFTEYLSAKRRVDAWIAAESPR